MYYVCSDIHGNREAFVSLLKKIQLKPDDTLYVLGDVIDRHPDGIRILRKLMSMENVKMVMGNHEYMMLEALGLSGEISAIDNDAMDLWVKRNGGDITLNYLKHIRKDLRREILTFLADLPLEYRVTVGNEQFILVHAAPPSLYSDSHPRYKIYGSKEEFSVWYRLHYYDQISEGTVVFGHTPTYRYQEADPLRIYYGDNKIIGIDCGAGLPSQDSPFFRVHGRLGCLRLEDMKEFYSD